MIFVSALTGKRVEKILELVDTAAEQHKRRVTTSVINEVLQEAVGLAFSSRQSPRTPRQNLLRHSGQKSATDHCFVC
jgi:GTP-binding protein